MIAFVWQREVAINTANETSSIDGSWRCVAGFGCLESCGRMNDRYRQKLKYRKHHPAEIIVICGEHAYRWGPDGVFEEIEL